MKIAPSLLAFVICASSIYADDAPVETLDEIVMLDPSQFRRQPLPQEELDLFLKPERKSPYVTVGLSFLSPGLGHLYLGDLKTAAGLGGSWLAFTGMESLDLKYSLSHLYNQTAMMNIWSYNVYATYRDVRIYNQQAGYKFNMPTDSLLSLALAPFKWSVIKQPRVWGGVLGALTLGLGVGYFLYEPDAHLSVAGQAFPLIAFPVGIGEEALFRGFLQPCLSEWTTPLGGIILSSLAFGAAHIPNAFHLEGDHRFKYYVGSLPLITAMGAYLGYLSYKSGSLKESVAVHAWYDFILFTMNYSLAQSAIGGTPTFALSIPF